MALIVAGPFQLSIVRVGHVFIQCIVMQVLTNPINARLSLLVASRIWSRVKLSDRENVRAHKGGWTAKHTQALTLRSRKPQ